MNFETLCRTERIDLLKQLLLLSGKNDCTISGLEFRNGHYSYPGLNRRTKKGRCSLPDYFNNELKENELLLGLRAEHIQAYNWCLVHLIRRLFIERRPIASFMGVWADEHKFNRLCFDYLEEFYGPGKFDWDMSEKEREAKIKELQEESLLFYVSNPPRGLRFMAYIYARTNGRDYLKNENIERNCVALTDFVDLPQKESELRSIKI